MGEVLKVVTPDVGLRKKALIFQFLKKYSILRPFLV